MPKTTILLIAEHTPEEGVPYTIEERNEQNKVISFEQFSTDGKPDQKIENDYDVEGKLLEQRQFFQEELTQRVQFSYSEAGKTKQETIIFMDGSKSLRNYTYNESENSILTVLIDEDGEEEERHYRRMDSEGRVVEEKTHSEGELEQHITSKIDDHGHLLERTILNDEGEEIKLEVIYERDDQGRIVLAKITDGQGALIRAEHQKFDDRGNRIELRVEDHQQGFATLEQWEYNLDNRIITHTQLSANGEPQAITQYAYDGEGRVVEEEQRNRGGIRLLKYIYE